nr:salutaridinol 7-O-acetyltransferase-like [Ipomoea trifida]
MTIECNDEGVDLVWANVTNYDLSDLLRVYNVDFLHQLLPHDPYLMDFAPSRPLLAAQTWAAINKGNGGSNLVVDPAGASAIFPPAVNFDFSSSTSSFAARLKMGRGKFARKRFVFHETEIEQMRDILSVSDRRRRPTRVEALSAFLWAAVIRANNNQTAKMYILT